MDVTTTTDKEQLKADALHHLQRILELSGIQAEATLESQEEDTVTFAITGPDANLLIGHQGQNLDALQYLLMLMTNRQRDQRLRITVDAAGYRQRRTQTLTTFAQDLAAQVVETRQEAITDPLNAMERRIIHTALVDHPEVQTYSEGDEPNRYVVISPRQSES